MLGKQTGKAIRALDLSHIYGGRPMRRRVRVRIWLTDHLDDAACLLGVLALMAAIWYLCMLWFTGTI